MPIHFQNRDRSYFLTTNVKVLFSTLKRQPNLIVAPSKTVFINSIIKKLFHVNMAKNYLLVRNPYERLESFYRDKFINHPCIINSTEKNPWQHCQRIFFKELGLSKSNFFEIKSTLTNTSFEQFIYLLSLKHIRDMNLIPQVYALDISYRRFNIKIKFDKVLKIEDENCMHFLKNRLDIDTSIRENYTKHLEIITEWDANLRKIVNSLYKDDFIQFKYEMLNR